MEIFINMKKIRLNENDIERLVKKILKEDIDRLTHSDIEDIKELYEEGLEAEQIVIEMDYKDYITLEDVQWVINEH